MIPFEEEASLNESEEYVEGILKSQWDNVVRSTPGVKKDLEGRYPKVSELVSERIRKDSSSKFSNIFRPGVPDFLAFNDDGNYLFVEVKSSGDGLRHTQLSWLRDFEGVNFEIWFADTHEVEKLDAENFQAYGFQDVKKGSYRVEERSDSIMVEVPEELARIIGLSGSVEWKLKSEDELILDNR